MLFDFEKLLSGAFENNEPLRVTMVDAMREAVECEDLSFATRNAFRVALEKYDYRRTHTREYLKSQERRNRILGLMNPGEEVTAEILAERYRLLAKNHPWSDWISPMDKHMNNQQVGCLLRMAVRDGVVVRRTEDVEITVFSYSSREEVPITAKKSFYTLA